MKTISGYRVTITAFLPTDPNDPRDIVQAGTILAELQTYLPEDLFGVEIRHQFVARHRIEIPEGPSGTAREAPSAGVQPAAPPTDNAPLPESAGGGECRHGWVQSDEPSRRLCMSCGVVDDLLDLTGTPLDRRARA